MKKNFFSLLLLALVFPAAAQRSQSAGIRMGANFSTITHTVFSARTAFYAGAVGEMRMSDFYALQLEVGYSQQGARGEVTDKKSYKRSFSDSGIRTGYFTAGAMNKFTFNRIFSFMLGVSGEQELSRNLFVTKALDLAAVAGVEYKFLPGFGIEVRAKRGLFDIFENSQYTTGEYTGNLLLGSQANLVFQAGLIYHFKEKNK